MCEYISAFTLLCFAVLVQLLHQGVKRKQEVAAVPGRWGWNTPDSDHTGNSVQLFVTCVCVCGSGGWYCFDSQTCESRYETMRRLMSSTKWPLTRTGTGPTVCACRIHFYTLPSLSGCSFTNSSHFFLLFRGCPNWHMALLLFLSIIMKCPWKLTVVKLH